MKVKSYIFNVIIALQAMSCFCTLGSCKSSRQGDKEKAKATTVTTDTTALLVMRVRECARLYTSEMLVHKIVTHTDDPHLKGKVLGMSVDVPTRVGHRSIAIPIDVTLKAYIDFSSFSANNVQRTDSTLHITLPHPQVIVTGTRVDNPGTRQYVDALRSRYTDAEITNFAHQGADSITAHLSRFGLEEQARQSATRQLVPLLTQLGYKEPQITIRFAHSLTDKDWKVIKQ